MDPLFLPHNRSLRSDRCTHQSGQRPWVGTQMGEADREIDQAGRHRTPLPSDFWKLDSLDPVAFGRTSPDAFLWTRHHACRYLPDVARLVVSGLGSRPPGASSNAKPTSTRTVATLDARRMATTPIRTALDVDTAGERGNATGCQPKAAGSA